MKNFYLFIILFISAVISVNAQFGSQNIITESNSPGANFVISSDIDGDGDQDLVSTSIYDHKIAWFENIDGYGNFGNQHVISTSADRPQAIFSIDIDGDGDQDILSASNYDNKIAWYENIDGNGTFGSQQIITTNANWATGVFSIDIDGDGDYDVLSSSSNDNKIAWYENIDGNGTFSSQIIITTSAEGASSVYSIDIDGDGDFDVLSSSENDSKIAWYENLDGNGSFGTQNIISTDMLGASIVYSVDIDGDGDQDVIAGASWQDDKIVLFKNTDGNGTFVYQQDITTNIDTVLSISAADVDGDGDQDLISASVNDNKIAWYENVDGNGLFVSQHIISIDNKRPYSIFATDIDSDGYIDVLCASLYDDKVSWFKNVDGNGNFSLPQIISYSPTSGANSVYTSDLDGDGYQDILSASYGDDKIAWYRNINGTGNFDTQQIISTDALQATFVYSADIDGDGDFDVLSVSRSDDKIAWYENIDGNGTFGSQQIITTEINHPIMAYSSDIDGDGDQDVIATSNWEDIIAWYENMDGNGTFGNQQIITTEVQNPSSIFITDIDNDGDFDVVSSSSDDNKIAWYENMDGNGTFGNQQIITTNTSHAYYVYTTDLDNDGDPDVLSASVWDDKIAWYENLDGNGNFGNQIIISTEADYPTSLYAADIDNDGDQDVLSSSSYDNKIAWYENLDSNGTFGSQEVISIFAQGALSVFASDLDNDGDMDVLSASLFDDKIAWYENTGMLGVVVDNFNKIKIYPNPVTETLNIESNFAIVEIKIYDILGRLVVNVDSDLNQIDVSNLSCGLLFVKIETNDGVITKKIIKE